MANRAKTALLVGALGLLVGTGMSVPADARDRPRKLVFVSYPDPAEELIARIVREAGNVYRDEHSGVQIDVKTDVPFGRARRMVLEHRNYAMMVSKRMFRMRRRHLKRNKRKDQFKLSAFTPIAIRVIRSREEVLARERLGVMYDNRSPAMASFLDAFHSKQGRSILNGMEFVEPVDREGSND